MRSMKQLFLYNIYLAYNNNNAPSYYADAEV